MEEFELKLVRENEPELLKWTKCSAVFLSYFAQRGILSDDEINRIENTGSKPAHAHFTAISISAMDLRFNNRISTNTCVKWIHHHTEMLGLKSFEELRENQALSKFEVPKTQERQQDDSAQASVFYALIKTRSGSFEALMQALEKTNQTGVRNLFEKDVKPGILTKPKKDKKFGRIPKYLDSFLSEPNPSEIIVISPDIKLTCQRIYKSVSSNYSCHSHTYSTFLDILSDDASTNSDYPLVFVVNCDGEYCFTHENDEVNAKVILVVSQHFNNTQTTAKVVEEEILWIELTPSFRRTLVGTVHEATELPAQDCSNVLSRLNSNALFHLVQGKAPPVFSKTTPNSLAYYVARSLVTRNIITNDIFNTNVGDIFLVEGVQRNKLTELVNTGYTNNVTDTSSNVVNNFFNQKSKFVLLEDPSHFDKLARLCPNSMSIHRLEYKDFTLKWKQSHGNVRLVQQFISNKQTKISEETLVVESNIGDVSRRVVCISDTPGMGKSVLLGHIGNLLEQSGYKENVAFVVLSELIQQTKFKKPFESNVTEGNIVESLGNLICENELGKMVLLHKPAFLRHLLLDAFDEIGTADIERGFSCLKILLNVFPETTLWITTRPHMLLEMEQRLCVLAYNIQPFDEENQLEFLSTYYLQSHQIEDDRVEKLRDFGKMCIESLQSRIIKEEADFAGIPLQCLLIAEVYEENAREYAGSQQVLNKNTHGNVRIASILDLYETLVAKKVAIFLERYNSEASSSIIESVHIYYAIELIFPEYINYLAKCCSVDISVQELTRVIFDTGILETKPTKYDPTPRFIHRTFAEFFVAKFLADQLETIGGRDVLDLLYEAVLDTVETSLNISLCNVTARNFKNNVIAYFLDAMLHKNDSTCDTARQCTIKNVNQIAAACAYSNSCGIFRKLVLPVLEIKPELAKEVFVNDFAIVSVVRAGRLILSKACTMFEKYNPKLPIRGISASRKSLLDLAVIRGNYSTVEYLISIQGYDKDFRVKVCARVLCNCINNSFKDTVSTIQDKTQILSYLVQKVNGYPDANLTNCLNKITMHKNLNGIHYLLLLKLQELVPLSISTVLRLLQSNVKFYTCHQLKYMITYLSEKYKLTVDELCNQDSYDGTLLFHILSSLEIEDHFLGYINQHGVTVKLLSEYKQESLFQAVVGRKESKRLIKYVIQYFELSKYINTLLRWCCKNGRWTAALILLRKFKKSNKIIEINFEDMYMNFNCLKVAQDTEKLLQFWCENDFNIAQNVKQYKKFVDCLVNIRPLPVTTVNLYIMKNMQNFPVDGKKTETYIIARMFFHCPLVSVEQLFLVITQFKNQPVKELTFQCSNCKNPECQKSLLEITYEYMICKSTKCNGNGFQQGNQIYPLHLEDVAKFDIPTENKLNYIKRFVAYFKHCNIALQLCRKWEIKEKMGSNSGCVFMVCETILQKIIYMTNGEEFDLLKALIGLGANVNTEDENRRTPLFAVASCNNSSVNYWNLIHVNGGNPFYRNKQNIEPIILMLKNLQTNVLTLYIQRHGTKIPNFICAAILQYGFHTVLEVCKWYGLQYPDNPIKNLIGVYKGMRITPLDAALSKYDGDTLEFIYRNGCTTILAPFGIPDVIKRDHWGRPHSVKKFLQVLSEVIKETPHIRQIADVYSLPLFMDSQTEIRMALIDYECNMNVKDAEGNTPLHFAPKLGLLNMSDLVYVQKLIGNGADVNAENKNNKTPFQICLQECLEIIPYYSVSASEDANGLKKRLEMLCIMLQNYTDIHLGQDLEKLLDNLFVEHNLTQIGIPFLKCLKNVLLQRGLIVLHSNKVTNQILLDLCATSAYRT